MVRENPRQNYCKKTAIILQTICPAPSPQIREILRLLILLILVTDIFIGLLQIQQSSRPVPTIFDERFGSEFGQQLAEWDRIKFMAGYVNIGIGLVGFFTILYHYTRILHGKTTNYFDLTTAIIIVIMTGAAIASDCFGIISNEFNSVVNRFNWMLLMIILVILLLIVIYLQIVLLKSRKKKESTPGPTSPEKAMQGSDSTPEPSLREKQSETDKVESISEQSSPKLPEQNKVESTPEQNLEKPPQPIKEESTPRTSLHESPKQERESIQEQSLEKPPQPDEEEPSTKKSLFSKLRSFCPKKESTSGESSEKPSEPHKEQSTLGPSLQKSLCSKLGNFCQKKESTPEQSSPKPTKPDKAESTPEKNSKKPSEPIKEESTPRPSLPENQIGQ